MKTTALLILSTGLAVLPTALRADMTVSPSTGFALVWDGNEADHFQAAIPALAPANLANGNGAVAFSSSDLGPELGIAYHVVTNLNDGYYGNSNSWIGGAFDGQAFAGIKLGGLKTLTGFAFGRDNGNGNEVVPGGQLTDRCLGFYTVQFTRVAAPDSTTEDTGDSETGWQTLGDLNYASNDDTIAGGDFTGYFRHEFEMAEGTSGIEATGFRILVPGTGLGNGTAIDEIELYGPSFVDPDADGDGFDDTVEVGLGTDPKNPASTPESISKLEVAVEFSFYAAKGKNYRIESSGDMQKWNLEEDNIPGLGLEITRLYSKRDQNRRFYRSVRMGPN